MSETARMLNRWDQGIRAMIGKALQLSDGNFCEAARYLGISHPTVRSYARKYGFFPWNADKAKAIMQ